MLSSRWKIQGEVEGAVKAPPRESRYRQQVLCAVAGSQRDLRHIAKAKGEGKLINEVPG